MLVGVDVYKKRRQKFGGMLSFVATMNQGYSRYWSTVKPENDGEIGPKMQLSMKEAIEEYCKENDNKVPERVIVFRDGISRFALKDVKANEIKGIRLAFEEIEKKYGSKPKLIFLLVNKKIDAKFFLEGQGIHFSFHLVKYT